MFRQLPDRQSSAASWGLVVAWMGIIVLTIPFARAIQQGFERLLGRGVYGTASALAGLFFALVVLAYMLRRRKRRVGLRIAWLAVLLALSVWLMRFQLQTPAEAIHFFQYGFLSYLLFRAWSHHVRDVLVYPVALFSVMIAASVDEFIQWMVPGRYWDFRDIRLNLLAGMLIQAFIALVIVPSAISTRVERRSVRTLCRVAWVTILLMALAFSNTPSRVDLYSARVPFLQFLANNESVMSEYGHLHYDPAIGRFYSRMTIPELQRIDTERGAEAGETIRRYRDLIDYREFLQKFTSSVDPFLHELRVHLYRRDHYYGAGWQYQESDPDRFRLHMTVAYRENQLLESYFPIALAATGERLGEDALRNLLAHADTNAPYTSPVSDHLVTRATELEYQLALLLLAAAVGMVYVRYGRERGPRSGDRTAMS